MSIIYDALKKVEGKTEGEQPKKAPSAVKFVVYAGIIILGILIASLFFNFISSFFQKDTKVASRQISGASTQAPVSLPEERKIQEPEKQPVQREKGELPPLALNGVFFADNTTVALINNQIVKEGDNIAGLTVLKIGEEEIVLGNQDSTVKLPIKTSW